MQSSAIVNRQARPFRKTGRFIIKAGILAIEIGGIMSGQNDSVALIGRVLMSVIFVTSGFGKLIGFSGTEHMIESKGVPLPEFATAIAILIELGAGLAILLGWKTRWAAAAFVVFLVVITPIFHGFWRMEGAERAANHINFMKNLTILGGFLLLYALGPGRFSVDGALRRRPLQRESAPPRGAIPAYANRGRSSPDRH
ncbi:MAG TPA: DoxX family protein [Casimicrobiaceae bacterium]|jgi:putative oxidoreductase